MLAAASPPAAERSAEFLRRMAAQPDGERVRQCIQCGTCSATCPVSHAMELSPRRIVAALQAGMLDKVLDSRSLWLCASCYACAVRCPSGVPFTDLMYGLKREAIASGRGDRRGAALSRAFVRTVDRLGRGAEAELLLRYYAAAGLQRSFAALPLALRLWRKGRLGLRGRRIQGQAGLQKMMAAIDQKGGRR
jgi:heterodisulfide reductase subunit C